MGKKFINANPIEINAVSIQKFNQSHVGPKYFAIPIGPCTALLTGISPLNILPQPAIWPAIVSYAWLIPAGIEAKKV